MNKEEIKLEKISYEELQDKYINENTTNYVLEKQNNILQQENKQLKEEIKSYQDMYFGKVMIINKAIEILHNINDDLPINLILEEIEHSEYILKGEE